VNKNSVALNEELPTEFFRYALVKLEKRFEICTREIAHFSQVLQLNT
jgi:hypothetical protein